MGYRFYKSKSLGKGMRVSVSKSGLGMSVGGKGMRYSVHSSGRTRKTVRVPGSGLAYQSYGSSKGRSGTRQRAAPPQAPSTMFKAPLFSSKAEKTYVKGIHAFIDQDYAKVYEAFTKVVELNTGILSGHFFAGMAANQTERGADSIKFLEHVVQADEDLPDDLMRKYHLDEVMMLPLGITPSVTVELEPTSITACLILAEIYQTQERIEPAIGLLENLVDLAPEIPCIVLSLSELYAQAEMWEELATVPAKFNNTDDLSAEVLRYKARAFRHKGMHQGALELLKEALKSKKRDAEILKAARYERALVYQEMGKNSQAKKDLERLYAEDPTYEDVASRLGT